MYRSLGKNRGDKMDKKKLKILLMITPIVTVLAIVLCIVFAKISDTKNDGKKNSEGFELDSDTKKNNPEAAKVIEEAIRSDTKLYNEYKQYF